MTKHEIECPASITTSIPKGYKLTEAGVIPDDWEIKTVIELVEPTAPICYGIVQVGKHTESGVPIVAIKFLSNIADAELHHASHDIEKAFARSRPQEGDVLISIKGTIGRVGIVPNGFSGNISREIARLRINTRYSNRFVAHSLESNSTQERIKRSIVGTTRLEFSIATLRQFKVAIPSSRAEQEAIAGALSDADAWIESLEQLIAKKRQIKQGAMQELLTGKRRLPGFSEEWETKQIAKIADIGRGRVINHQEITKSRDPKYPVYSSQTLGNGVMGYIDTFDYEGNYVTWTTDGANAGTVFARAGRFNCTNVCGTIRVTNGDYRFIALSLGRVAKNHVSKHLGNPKLMNDVMNRIEIFVPRLIDEQTAIATVLTEMDAEIESLESKLSKAREVKQGMMQELLTGRIRLI